MRRRHFRRLPRYRPRHGSPPSPFFVLRNKKRKEFSLSTLFSTLAANRRRASLVTLLSEILFLDISPVEKKHCEGRSKDNIKRINRKERREEFDREFTI